MVYGPLDAMSISLNKQKLMYNILMPSIKPYINSYRLMEALGIYIYICPWLAKG